MFMAKARNCTSCTRQGEAAAPCGAMLTLLLLFAAGVWAGAQNALAGGGSFVTLPALILAGLDAKLANIASTIAMFPGQVVSGVAGRRMIEDVPGLKFRTLAVISLGGGAAGALLLLYTSSGTFNRLVPWLVLIATGIFAWGNFAPRSKGSKARIGPVGAAALQGAVAVYGGYFSGGIGFLMMALLTMSGMAVRAAGAAKNMLAGIINASAVILFLATTRVPLMEVIVLGSGAVAGGLWGVWLLRRINESWLKIGILILGLALFAGLLLRAQNGS
ncbi:sulfite exporter TauE/SafE family protein [Sphingosinicella rhizophila]|uniref:Probable membrane transporter protein n=1 Tax=Sphingosinicella rhizophila TaxID=3050082 RepID=A0ABU3QA82_9SPHN|nr:sulfite exporter TauE/SafE family protein [Sphingosinicella sp. GR2756]MDT9600318.1 sulfite exporter TauE/SafE family protein [Sphingosinicella sp. GR2756]